MRRWLLLGLVSSACGDQQVLLPAEPDQKSVIFLVEGREPSVVANDLDAPGIEITAPRDSTAMFVLYYPQPLVELGLTRGSIAPLSLGELGRSLPASTTTYRASINGGTLDPFARAAANESSLFRDFRFALERPADCAARGGCFPLDEQLSPELASQCASPCELSAPPDAPILGEGGAPASPRIEPCPRGWTVERVPEISCVPYASDPVTCPRGQVHLPGTAGCERVGPVCPPAGMFPQDLPPNRPVVYVRAGAQGGNGSIASPFGRIQEALTPSPAGAVIAIAAGIYAEAITAGEDRVLIGACVLDVELVGSGMSDVVTVSTGGAALRDLSITSSNRAIAVEAAAVLSLVSVAISSAGDAVVLAPSAEITTSSSAIAHGDATGVRATSSGTVLVERTVMSGRLSLDLGPSTSATVTTSRIEGASVVNRAALQTTESSFVATTAGAAAITLRDDAVVTVRRSHVACARDVACGALLEADASELHVVRSTVGAATLAVSTIGGPLLEVSDSLLRAGLSTSKTKTINLTQSVIRGASRSCVSASGEAGGAIDTDDRLRIEEVTLATCAEHGIDVGPGTALELRHAVVDDARGFGIQVVGTTTNLEATAFAEDAILRNTGRGGMSVDSSRRTKLNRVSIVNAGEVGLRLGDQMSSPATEGAHVEISGAPIGVEVAGGTLMLTTFRLADLTSLGLETIEGATQLRSGSFERMPIAFRAHSPEDARELMRGVSFTGVATICEVCGD